MVCLDVSGNVFRINQVREFVAGENDCPLFLDTNPIIVLLELPELLAVGYTKGFLPCL